ncbi:MAG TPA: tRNA pseudouridine(38-40) synthase TruA [Sediminispirochaeta sp.]|nr:tRNA pseudouridine(38-40) synthase TruA [Sediminispirochaeta sp.]
MGTRIKLVLAYDGSEYCGWQIQRGQPSIQERTQSALSELTGESVALVASGRTDSGVHARAQVCHFDVEKARIPSDRYWLALNRLLPRDIRALHSTEVHPDFHARFSALRREYRYYLLDGRVAQPFQDRYVVADSRLPALPILDSYARILPGIHDFSTFAAAGDPSNSPVRRIFAAGFYPQGEYTVFRIVGNAFLWRMVRSLVGTMLELGRRRASEEEFRRILQAGDRSSAGPTAPARGLFLHKVTYDE